MIDIVGNRSMLIVRALSLRRVQHWHTMINAGTELTSTSTGIATAGPRLFGRLLHWHRALAPTAEVEFHLHIPEKNVVAALDALATDFPELRRYQCRFRSGDAERSRALVRKDLLDALGRAGVEARRSMHDCGVIVVSGSGSLQQDERLLWVIAPHAGERGWAQFSRGDHHWFWTIASGTVTRQEGVHRDAAIVGMGGANGLTS